MGEWIDDGTEGGREGMDGWREGGEEWKDARMNGERGE